MILVVGGTGFIGRELVRQLMEMDMPVRLLVRPSRDTPKLLRGVSVEVAVTSLQDERGLRSAFRDVDIVFHLASDERRGSKADFSGVDIDGTRTLVKISREMGIKRMVYLSHLGADRGSAFAMLKTKSLAESHIIRSQVPYTIFRSAIVYGPGDQFTTAIARLLKYSPGLVFLPGDGSTLIQPIWVEDLVACLLATIENETTANQIFPVGGAEYFSIRDVLQIIMSITGRNRIVVPASPATLRQAAMILEQFIPRLPISVHWLDYLGSDRTCALDTLPRIFGIIPARFSHHLGYLRGN